MKPISLFLIIILLSCTSDPATEEALEVSKQIKEAQDSIDARIERAKEIIQEMGNSDSLNNTNEIRFDSIQPLGEDTPDSILRAIGVEEE